MAAQIVQCSCARDDVEVNSNGRCGRCGKVLRDSFAVQAMPARNTGVSHTSPSGAYRSPAAPFDPARSVANGTNDLTRENLQAMTRDAQEQGLYDNPEVSAGEHAPAETVTPEQGAGSEAVPPTPQPSPLSTSPAAPAPAPGLPTSEWIRQARVFATGFIVAAEMAEQLAAEIATAAAAQVATHKADAARFRKSAQVFEAMLEQIPDLQPLPVVPPPPVAAAEGPRTGPLPAGTWSRRHERCIGCKRTDRPHLANGRCAACDGLWRRQQRGAA